MKIANIGCGYIGKELSKELYKRNHFITATTKNPNSLEAISKISNKSMLLDGSDEAAIFSLMEENDTLIITLISNSFKDFENIFLNTARAIKSCALKQDKPLKIIFISKTRIYGNHNGAWVDEAAPLYANDEDSKVLIETEKVLLSLQDQNFSICILRSPNFYGPTKEIVDLFKPTYKNVFPGHGDYFTNMVHQKDIVGASIYALDHNLEGVFNISDDDHHTRQDIADLICDKLNLPKVKYDPTLANFPDCNKRVSNYRIKEQGYVLKYPHRKI